MIFHPERMIFFHPGKTAGTAIEYCFGYTHEAYPPGKANFRLFKGWDPVNCLYLAHATPRFMKARLPAALWNTYLKFTVVRNPYERLVPVYYYQHKQHLRQFGSFQNFVAKLPEVLQDKRLYNGSHYIPQYHYAYIDDNKVVDIVLQFESLDTDFKKICRLLGKPLTLAKVNSATSRQRPKGPIASLYSPDTVRIVQEIYRKDFECFGYAFDLPSHENVESDDSGQRSCAWIKPVVRARSSYEN